MEGKWQAPQTFQEYILMKAIYETEAFTLKLPNGEARMKAVEEILYKKRKNYDGMALELHYDWRTVQNWITSFVNSVGKKAGY